MINQSLTKPKLDKFVKLSKSLGAPDVKAQQELDEAVSDMYRILVRM
jgi:hypothetical protein